MLARFRQRDFAGASETIVRCRNVGGGFGLEYLFDLYTSRIRAFEQAPPPADWNGVFVLDSK
jgi:adenylate cyclase